MQLLCCKQQQSSLRIRPRSKNTDPQSVRDVSLNVATPLMVRGRNGRHSDGGYRSRHTDDDLSGRVFVGGCLCWWGGDVGGSVAPPPIGSFEANLHSYHKLEPWRCSNISFTLVLCSYDSRICNTACQSVTKKWVTLLLSIAYWARALRAKRQRSFQFVKKKCGIYLFS